MRTTLHLDDSLIREAKKLAAATGRTFTAVVEDALRAALARREKRDRRIPAKFATFRGNGLQPRVYLDDSAALLDWVERNE